MLSYIHSNERINYNTELREIHILILTYEAHTNVCNKRNRLIKCISFYEIVPYTCSPLAEEDHMLPLYNFSFVPSLQNASYAYCCNDNCYREYDRTRLR